MTHPELQALVAQAIYAPLLQSGQRLEFYHKMKADAAIEAVVRWLEPRLIGHIQHWDPEFQPVDNPVDAILADMEGRGG